MCDCSGNRLRNCEEKPKLSEYFKKNGIDSQIGVKFMIVDTELPPIDFSTAQVGDTVRCLLNGDVKVTENEEEGRIPIETETKDWYDFSGGLDGDHKYPCLIGFVDTDGNLCRTRPEPKIDWNKVAIDAPVAIRMKNSGEVEILHFSKINERGNKEFFRGGRTSHSKNSDSDVESFADNYATYKLINTEEK